jgi:proline dehydrogenase
MQGGKPPAGFADSIDMICHKATEKSCRVWIDAEQSAVQSSIDSWTIDLMRRWNKDGRAVVYNTIQAYLKSSRTKLKQHLALAQAEQWSLGIKLVRGAYIGTDPRHCIHDTKQDTDDSYNGIVHDLLSGKNLGFDEQNFPSNIHLFLAGHNPESVAKAWDLVQSLHAVGKLKVVPDFGQLQVSHLRLPTLKYFEC